MREEERIKKELEQMLFKVKQRLEILDMIEERLLQMRKLAQRVVDEPLTEEQIQAINGKMQELEQQIRLLDGETTQLS